MLCSDLENNDTDISILERVLEKCLAELDIDQKVDTITFNETLQ